MNKNEVFTLVNKQTGNLAFRLHIFHDNSNFDFLHRNNFYTLVWVKSNNGTLKTDFNSYPLKADSLFALSPYQHFLIGSDKLSGVAINFHSDFFCIHKHQSEVTCDGILFNNIHESPVFQIDKRNSNKFENVINDIKLEFENSELAQYEILISYLKIILISASRVKAKLSETLLKQKSKPLIISKLKDLIELHFKTTRSTSSYSDMLNISGNSLNKLVKQHYQKSLKQIITDRVIIEAKRELYLTNKTTKEIAYELGFNDEFYFSRIFKRYTNISPTIYRKTVGFGKEK